MTYTYQPKDEALNAEYQQIKNSPRKALRFAEQLYNSFNYKEMKYISQCSRDPECENMYEAFFLNQCIKDAERRRENRRRNTDLIAYDLIAIRNKVEDEKGANMDFEERDRDCIEYMDMLDEVSAKIHEIENTLRNWR